MFSVPCTVCGDLTPGYPDADVTCAYCERNFDGDPLRKPPRQQRHPLPWRPREDVVLPPVPDGLRALTGMHGRWHDNQASEDGADGW